VRKKGSSTLALYDMVLGVRKRIDMSASVRFANVVLMAQAFSVPGGPGLKIMPLVLLVWERELCFYSMTH
jgi:hypothetical protein